MRVLSYNVHSCVGTDAQISINRVARVIARAEPDVVCLQEIDVGRRRTRRADQARELAEALSMEFHFHSAMSIGDEDYGDAILSRHPLRLIRAGLLPTARGLLPVEPRGVLWAAVTIDGADWQIFNTHFGLGRDERRVQARALVSTAWAGGVPRDLPLVVCGDLNSRPASRAIAIVTEKVRNVQAGGAHLKTFPTHFPVICLDYCFVGEGIRIDGVRTITSVLARVASDHFPLVADLTWDREEKTLGAKRTCGGASESEFV